VRNLDPRNWNASVRGLAIIVLVAAAITASGTAGDLGLGIVFLVLRIAFVIVVAIVVFRLWRANRERIAEWPRRSQLVFYGAAALALVDLVASFAPIGWPGNGLESLVFFGVLAACAYAMWRVWRDEHTYAY
jgi:tellurite resistance protein TehA-like permease